VANHKSAEKRYRQSIKRTARNAAIRSRMRGSVRKLLETVQAESKDAAKLGEQLKNTVSEIMRARSKGIIKKTTASRKVARLSRLVHRTSGK
jgi:small subunit ribosomal protein S20